MCNRSNWTSVILLHTIKTTILILTIKSSVFWKWKRTNRLQIDIPLLSYVIIHIWWFFIEIIPFLGIIRFLLSVRDLCCIVCLQVQATTERLFWVISGILCINTFVDAFWVVVGLVDGLKSYSTTFLKTSIIWAFIHMVSTNMLDKLQWMRYLAMFTYRPLWLFPRNCSEA